MGREDELTQHDKLMKKLIRNNEYNGEDDDDEAGGGVVSSSRGCKDIDEPDHKWTPLLMMIRSSVVYHVSAFSCNEASIDGNWNH